MLRYLGRQSAQTVFTVLGVVTVVFFLLRTIPGDPATYMLGDYATAASVASLRHQLGLDLPIYVQYGRFLSHAASGDLGSSVQTGMPALAEVLQSAPPSAALAVAGMAIAVAVGVPAGIAAATRQGSAVDVLVTVGALFGTSFPVFWIGVVSILFFAHWLKLFPALGASSSGDLGDAVYHLVLPALVLGLSVAAYIARLTRSAMLEVLGQDHIRVARALGVRERRIVGRLALRNALIPILAIVGVTFAWSLGSAILVEAVFSRPGLGTSVMKAILARDYQVVQAGVLVLALAVVVINGLLDVAYGLIDPRVRTP